MKAVRQTGGQKDMWVTSMPEDEQTSDSKSRRTEWETNRQERKESGTQTDRFQYVCMTDLLNTEAARKSSRRTDRM